MADPTWLDWDSIREVEGFKVDDHVRVARCKHIGIIKNLILVSPNRYRALVRWPTIPFECEGVVYSPESVQFIDVSDLSQAVLEPSGEQLALI